MGKVHQALISSISLGSLGLVSSAHAAGLTTMTAVIPQLQGEAQSWLIAGAVIAISVGLLAQGMSRMQTEFTAIFGHVIEWAGRAAFGAAGLAIIALVAPATADPLTALSPQVVWDFVLETLLDTSVFAVLFFAAVGVIYGVRRRSSAARA